jgi:hypothetical protein
MRVTTRLPSMLMTLALTSVSIVVVAAYAWTQQPAQERPVWDVQMAPNAQAASTITIQNQCQQTHSFTVAGQQTPYLQLPAPPTAEVAGNSSYQIPVRFNTNGMNAGQYQGMVLIKCETCRKEKTCKQDREMLPVRLIVGGQNGPQMIPQPESSPSPTVKPEEKPKATPTATPTPTTGKGPTRPGYDEKGKPTKDDKREFDSDDQKNYPISECAECTVPQIVEDNKEKFVQCGGACIGAANCPIPTGYICNLFLADKEKNPKDKKLPKWRKVTGGKPRTKPDSSGKTVYTCACSK